MASPAQITANVGNARFSTGPVTAEGKARSSRNAASHGLTTGFLRIEESEREAYEVYAEHLDAALLPEGLIEDATCQQVIDAGWRIRKIHVLYAEMAAAANIDPLIDPGCARALKQLARYRATAEMALYRALKTLAELQTRRAARHRHLLEIEKVEFPVHLEPKLFARARWSTEDRKTYLRMHGRLGPRATWELVVDKFHQATWVRRKDGPEPVRGSILQNEPNLRPPMPAAPSAPANFAASS